LIKIANDKDTLKIIYQLRSNIIDKCKKQNQEMREF